ncbi:MAG: Uma2 family endonuclease [Armatimonadetes bacterium]|nr:Uma2 family endonuclease [Armatimonadota bacterium]
MNVVAPIKEGNVLLPHVSWQTYEQILCDSGDTNAHRFYYDRGRLEIVMPSQQHEKTKSLLHTLVECVADTWEWDFLNFGSTTFKNESLTRGFEPDVCFYVQRYAEIFGKETLEFPADPAPDLVIEVDITSPSLEGLPLYGKFGVREVWRADASGTVTIHRFDDAGAVTYEADSAVLTGLTGAQITTLLTQNKTLSRRDWINAVREWAQTNPPA